jgi:predicted RNA-binding Zn-ribbon protein involved in translation (DUF1610 family)
MLVDGTDTCRKCGIKIDSKITPLGSFYCSYCGSVIATGMQICPECGKEDVDLNSYQDIGCSEEAKKAANISLIAGIVGIFIFGLPGGILAVFQGNKALKLGYTGVKTTIGIVLGIIDIIFWAIIMLSRCSTY